MNTKVVLFCLDLKFAQHKNVHQIFIKAWTINLETRFLKHQTGKATNLLRILKFINTKKRIYIFDQKKLILIVTFGMV